LAGAVRSWQSPTKYCQSSPAAFWQQPQEESQLWRKQKPPQQKQRLAARLGVHGLAQAVLPALQQEQSRKRLAPRSELGLALA
jgi:hypothetical protein